MKRTARDAQKLAKLPQAGERVRLMKRTIEDVPYGHVGTVVGHTRADGTGSIIVGFDDIPHVRYLKRADLHRVALAEVPALTPSPAYRPQDGDGA